MALRGESLVLGDPAKAADLVVPARLQKITYRGVYRDYRLRLEDGQELSATLTQRLAFAEGSPEKYRYMCPVGWVSTTSGLRASPGLTRCSTDA